MDINETVVPFRPWFTIWRHPRETVQLAIDYQTTSQLYSIAGLFAVFSTFSDMGETSRPIMDSVLLQVGAVVLTILLTMLLMVEGFPRLLGWTGGIFQVYKPLPEIKRGFVTTLIPFLPFMLFGILADKLEAGLRTTSSPDFGGGSWFALGGAVGLALPMMLLGLGILVWLLSIACRGVAALFGYSAWKALIHLTVSWVLFTLAAIVVALPLAMLFD